VSRRSLWLLLPLAVGLALVAWLLATVDLRATLEVLAHVSAAGLAALVVLSAVTHLVLADRLALCLNAGGDKVSRLTLVGQRLAAFAVSYATPGPQVGGESLQALLLARAGVPLARGAAALIADRTLESATTAAVLSTLAALAWARGVVPPVTLVALAPLWLVLAGGAAAYAAGARPLAALARRGWLPVALARTLAEAETNTVTLVADTPGLWPRAVVRSLAGWSLAWLEVWLVATSLGVTLGGLEAATVLAAARLAILLPLPAGLGAFEAAHVVAFEALGLGAGPGLAFAAVVRGRDVLAACVGAGIAAAHARRPPATVAAP